MNYPIGTKLKVINAGGGARGCNGSIGVVMSNDIDTAHGLSNNMNNHVIKIVEGKGMAKEGDLWGVKKDGEYEVIEHVFKVGDKIKIPTQKSIGSPIDKDNNIRHARDIGKDFMYITRIHNDDDYVDKGVKTYYVIDCQEEYVMGNHYTAEDLELYVEPDTTETPSKEDEVEFKVGDKVVPHQKTAKGYEGLEYSGSWKKAKDEQGYLYLVSIDKQDDGSTLYALWHTDTRETFLGDYYALGDFTLYQEPIKDIEKGEEPVNTDSIMPTETVVEIDEDGHKVIWKGNETIVILNVGNNYVGYKKGKKRKTFKARCIFTPCEGYEYSRGTGYTIAVNKAIMRLCQYNLKQLMK